MSKAALLADLRIILRHLKKLPSDGKNYFKAHAMGQIRANMAVSDKSEARNLRWKAHDAAQLIAGLRTRKELLDAHAGEKMTQEERIKLTALRVGLNTPLLYDGGEEGERSGGSGNAREGAQGGT
ncbi:unnamed protein product [Ascophyllum nodosum]